MTALAIIMLLTITGIFVYYAVRGTGDKYHDVQRTHSGEPHAFYLKEKLRKKVIKSQRNLLHPSERYRSATQSDITHKTKDFVVIDFETANFLRESACAIGIAVVKDLEIVETKHYYISPQHEMGFLCQFVQLHGISWETVYDKPCFNELWPEIEPYFTGSLVIAYNAEFDMTVLSETLNFYGMGLPDIVYACALKCARKEFSFANYKLQNVCRELNIELNHHHAESDAKAAAMLTIMMIKRMQDREEKRLLKKEFGALLKYPAVEIPQNMIVEIASSTERTDDPVELARILENLKRRIREHRKKMDGNEHYRQKYLECIAKYEVLTGKKYR